MTNFEKIKNMTIEEMAVQLSHFNECERFCKYVNSRGRCACTGTLSQCFNGVLEWLESEEEKAIKEIKLNKFKEIKERNKNESKN